MDTATWVGVVVAPALLGTVVYFVNDYLEKTERKFTRLEGMIESVEKSGIDKLSTIKHQIEVVTRDDTRHIIHAEIDSIKMLMKSQHERVELKQADIKILKEAVKSIEQRHEKYNYSILLVLQSHDKRIKGLHDRLNELKDKP